MPARERGGVPEEREVVHRDDERRPRRDGRAERRAVQDVEAGRRAPEAEGVPQPVPPERREAPRPAGLETDELETGTPGELPEQPPDVSRRPGPRLDERRRVDADPHTAALRTASRGSG